jgi:hypothetical protein
MSGAKSVNFSRPGSAWGALHGDMYLRYVSPFLMFLMPFFFPYLFNHA